MKGMIFHNFDFSLKKCNYIDTLTYKTTWSIFENKKKLERVYLPVHFHKYFLLKTLKKQPSVFSPFVINAYAYKTCYILTMSNSKLHDSYVLLLYKGEYSPPFYFHHFCPRCQLANLRLGEFSISNLLSLNTTVYGWIQDGAKLCNCRRGEITWGKITLYTVVHGIEKTASLIIK